MFIELVFWTALSILLFTYAGYPVLLCVLAPFRRQPVIRPLPFEPAISIMIPARNEAAHIAEKLRNCAELNYPVEKIEIILIDDGSEDATARIALDFARSAGWRILGNNPPSGKAGEGLCFRLVSLSRRHGKATALNRGVEFATGDILVFTDADSLISPNSLIPLLHPFINPIVGCTAGKYIPGGLGRDTAPEVGFYWRYENFLRKMESRVGGLLGASGSLYTVRRPLFDPLNPRLINDDFIVPMRTTAKGYRSLFVPEATAVEDALRCAEHEFPRRVRIMAGNIEHILIFHNLIWDWRRWRTAAQLVCHKLLRVLSPLFLIAALASNAVLAAMPEHGVLHLIYTTVFVLQILFYTGALAGYFCKTAKGACRVLSPMYYFVMINFAALSGMYFFFFNRGGLLWTKQPAPAREPAS